MCIFIAGIRGRSMFECVDRDQESLPGGSQPTGAPKFHTVEVICNQGGIPCPPYNPNQELNCVVCTK